VATQAEEVEEEPTEAATEEPTAEETASETTTEEPTETPTEEPTAEPTATASPTEEPTVEPTPTPSGTPVPPSTGLSECDQESPGVYDCGPGPWHVVCPPGFSWFVDRNQVFAGNLPAPDWQSAFVATNDLGDVIDVGNNGCH
jgi:hypothetical protein